MRLSARLRAFELKIDRIKSEVASLGALESMAGETAQEIAEVEASIRALQGDWSPDPLLAASRRLRRSR